ncbi:restriction endonuclease subunit S [Stenotrophomonas acidaminiphila]|uniref:restriction endonuclease subunit S n=1 Tax=Stenotrophomonas acidaminiphila TaxID=128780 RepID=UPI0028AA15EE|nr:restriction endonuclease subunit S [Stenotrophomonas acidaminiphila]
MNSEIQWFEKPLGEVTCNHDGKRKPVKESERKKGPYPYYGASGIVDYVDGYLFDGRYLLVAEDGENLRTRQTPIAFMADGKFWVNNHAHIVTGSEEVTTEYLHYFLQYADIQSYLTGAVMPKLTQGNLNRIPVRYPEPDYQKQIIQIPSFLDRKIDLNRRINQTLEAMAQAIFKSWFVDFDPVKAKIVAIEQGEDPLRAAMRAISGKTDAELGQMPREHHNQLATTAALFPDVMEESAQGEVPKGWETALLSKMTQLIGGGTPKRSESIYWGGTIPWFSVRDVPNDGDVWVVDTAEKITEIGLQKSSTKLLRKGTTIISARGTVGKLAMVGQEMAMNQSCYGVVGAEGVGDFFNYFNLEFAVETLKRNTHGAVFDTITQATFETVICVKPENSVMKQFDEIVAPLLKCIRSNVFQNRELAELRDTLLPKLLSGEVSVEALMNEVSE